jgi:dTMP kinase
MSRRVKGRFLVLDGTDGCGKTTQIHLLQNVFENRGFSTVETRDPGGTEIGEQIRRLLKYDAKGKMDVRTELMLFMASRAQLAVEVIRPTLEEGKIVLCDRFVSSSCAYQGAGGYPPKKILSLARYAIGKTWPDLTIILDLPVEEGQQRIGRRKNQISFLASDTIADRFDSRTLEYHQKVRNGFLALPDYYPAPVVVLETAGLSAEQVHQRITALLEERKWFDADANDSQPG